MKDTLNHFLKILWPLPADKDKISLPERLLLLWVVLLFAGLFIYLSSEWGYLLGLSGQPLHFNIYCPACGGTRALNYLLAGNLALAWHNNQLFVITLPVTLWIGFVFIRSIISGYPITGSQVPSFLLWLLLSLVLIFFLVRNIPLPAMDYFRPPL